MHSRHTSEGLTDTGLFPRSPHVPHACTAPNPAAVAAGAAHYLRLMGVVSGGWLLTLGALRASRRKAAGDSDPLLEQKLVSARFFADQYLPQAAALKTTILQGGGTVTGVSPDAF